MVIYFEARSLPEIGQKLVAQVVIDRAKDEKLTICQSVYKPKNYSFLFDNKPELVSEIDALVKAMVLGRQVYAQNKSGIYRHFNTCKLGKRFTTKVRLKQIDNMCFY